MTQRSNDESPTSVYLYYDDTDVLIYVGITGRGVTRNTEHNISKDWWGFVSRQEVRHFPSREGALTEERMLIRKHRPPFNVQHNPDHKQARAAYVSLAVMKSLPLDATEGRELRRHLPLEVLPNPLPGHSFTLHTRPEHYAALSLSGVSGLDPNHSVVVSTPQRMKSGRVLNSRLVGGMLVIGITGKYLPPEVVCAHASIKVTSLKPRTIRLARVFLNDYSALGRGTT